MISTIQKLAPGRLSRAILALVRRSGNRTLRVVRPNLNEPLDPESAGGYAPTTLSKRTTITVETERLLVVSSEWRVSRSVSIDEGDRQSINDAGREAP
jgi:hypothetical protein